MKNTKSRRDFIKAGTTFCFACGALAVSPGLNAMSSSLLQDDEIPDPKKLEYCGYSCPADCPMYVATMENNVAKKEEAYKNWKIKEHYGLDFDPEKVFCYRCKSGDKPAGVVTGNCPVRACAIEKNLDCCIECGELATCNKELWTRFPDFYQAVLKMQVKYRESKA